ncbi:primosomal protein N' [Antrihabitans cavernicola]|uniref:Probable replication restart protein PriA n=1 Tax=Antrihabitans cavernicola TaxID=2495913 RepID=A0A5A7SC34_9NOCA|nr:primosomal protein N' [Spelaeibacter cavernicola]KAA0023700.1 primosomal protein N' [Spelaeibacter cavernicola]
MLPLAHLDRVFDYLVPVEFDEAAQPGVRVRIRFAGRLVDGFLLERIAVTEHLGKLGFLDRVVSPERVLTPEIADLVTAVAGRYAGTRADVLRLAIPPRHAKVEAEETSAPEPGPDSQLDEAGWGRYSHGDAFLRALTEGRGPHAAWQALPGEDWPRRLAELACAATTDGSGAVLVVPDQRDLDRVHSACVDVVGDEHVVALAAGLGPSARYRRWLAALRGQARIVVGTRSSVFAPVPKLGLIAIWDDGDASHAEPRAPYPHAREVALLRAHATKCAFVAGGFSRTAEVQSLVDSGWAHDLVAPRNIVRESAPKVTVPGDSDHALERDPAAKAARLPAIAFAAARTALAAGNPVLVQVPRKGYVPSLACAKCRTPARCRRCNGPLALPSGATADVAASPTCRWCGEADAAYRCAACGSRALRAVVVGAGRTAEELGRAFAGVSVQSSSGTTVADTVKAGPRLVVATVGAEPVAAGGYGAALLLDGWALLGRADLRAAEEALRRWMTAAALVKPAGEGGQVVIVADPGLPTVQALVRWDPVGHAEAQLAERAEVRFPPAARVAAVDGSAAAIASLLDVAELPDGTELLGPVPLPDGARTPFAGDSAEPVDVERMLLRVPRQLGPALARALAAAQASRSARKIDAPVRIQVDPVDIG